jgi:hypothetical protein
MAMKWRTRLIPVLAAGLLLTSCSQDPTPDTEAPIVWISEPQDGAQIIMPDTLLIEADDNVGVTRVAAYANGESIGVDMQVPYEILFNTFDGVGSFDLSARAWDAAGNTALSDTISVLGFHATGFDGPSLIEPSDGLIRFDGGYVTFAWAPLPLVDEYEFALATDTEFTQIQHQTSTSDTTLTLTVDSPEWRYWRVRAHRDQGDWGEWSSAFSFFEGGAEVSFQDGLLNLPFKTMGHGIARVSGGYWIIGEIGGDILAMRLDASNQVQWIKVIPGEIGAAAAYFVEPLGNGGCLLLCQDGADVQLIELNPGGAEVWRRTFDHTDYNEPWDNTPIRPVGIVDKWFGQVAVAIRTGHGTVIELVVGDGPALWRRNIEPNYDSRDPSWNDSGGNLHWDLYLDALVTISHTYRDDYGGLTIVTIESRGLDPDTGAEMWHHEIASQSDYQGDILRLSALAPLGGTGSIGVGRYSHLPHLFFLNSTYELDTILPVVISGNYPTGVHLSPNGSIVITSIRRVSEILQVSVITDCAQDGSRLWEVEPWAEGVDSRVAGLLFEPDGGFHAVGYLTDEVHEDGVLWLKHFDSEGNEIGP